MTLNANTIRSFLAEYKAEARRMDVGPLRRGTERDVYGPAWAWQERAERLAFCRAEVARLTALLETLEGAA